MAGRRWLKRFRRREAANREKERRGIVVEEWDTPGSMRGELWDSLEKHGAKVGHEILHHARQTVGSLRGKKVLIIAPDKSFAKYLREVEGANLTEYHHLAQGMGNILKESGFKLVLAQPVFEHDAFETSHPRSDEIEAEMHRSKKNPANAVRAIQRRERISILKQAANKLVKGGYFVLTGRSSKTIFSDREATEAGFKIIDINKRNPPGTGYATILQKK